MDKVNSGKVGSCSIIKVGSGRLAMRENKVQRTWKASFEHLCNMNTQEHFAVHMGGFGMINRGNCYGGGLKWKCD